MKKTVIIILSVLLMLCMASCDNKAVQETTDSKENFESALYEIGDIILSDGSVIKEAVLTSLDSGNVPIAVIAGFWEDGTAFGVGVHRSDAPLQWAADDAAGYAAGFADTVCTQEADLSFSGDKNGSDNWNVICSVDGEASENTEANYPAFHFVNAYAQTYALSGDYASGWYMPSIDELSSIYQNRKAVNNSLQKIYTLDNHAAMDGLGTNWYWTSSQSGNEDDYVWFVHYLNGYAGECPKNFTNVHALAIRIF